MGTFTHLQIFRKACQVSLDNGEYESIDVLSELNARSSFIVSDNVLFSTLVGDNN